MSPVTGANAALSTSNNNLTKDLSNMSAQSGTTGVLSNSAIGKKSHRRKKNAVYIRDAYLVRECIYKGHFHNTYKGANRLSKQQLMIKMCNQYHEHITNENKIYKMVKELSCIPKVLHSGEEKINSTTYFVKVTESHGPSLKILYSLMGNSFSLTTVCNFAIHMLSALEELHKADVVHRNLRPRKIVIHNDLKNANLLLLDLKYARKFRHKNGSVSRYTENSRLLNKVFLSKFSSIGTHLGISPSRKDDMESLAYILVYFFRKGRMFGAKKQFKSREEKLKFYEEAKLSLVPETLVQDMPQEFIGFLTYVKAMNILDPPEYDAWKKTFKAIIAKQPPQENPYDWVPRIKSEVATIFGNNKNNFSVLQELDTPSVRESDPERKAAVSSHTKLESEDKQENQTVTITAAKPNMGGFTTGLLASESTAEQFEQNSPNNSKHLEKILQMQQQQQQNLTRNLNLDAISEAQQNEETAYYGAVDINHTRQLSSHSFKALASTTAGNYNANGTEKSEDTLKKNRTNNYNSMSAGQQNDPSFGDGFSEKKSKPKRPMSSEFDVTAFEDSDDDGEQNENHDQIQMHQEAIKKSLEKQIEYHNRHYVVNPFSFKSKMYK